MDRPRASLIVTMFTAVLVGCTGQVVDRASRVMDHADDIETASLGPADSDRTEFESELTKRYLAEIAAELEIVRPPAAQQLTVGSFLASLPTPSEMAALTPPGPLDGEAVESLTSAAEADQTCIAIHADNLANMNSTAFKRRVL